MPLPFSDWLISAFGSSTIDEAVLSLRLTHFELTSEWLYDDCVMFIHYLFFAQTVS